MSEAKLILTEKLSFFAKALVMSHYLCYITNMARGESGRIVIEVNPEQKRRLYAALALSGSTLKDWFLKNASDFCEDSNQPSLFNSTPSKSHSKLDEDKHLS